ncbi:hypothetical protein K0M31_002562 [Melipona bicolor]|uniref:Uncharacterized protein n=1 Tax=Melipona bicolor TaxID=60889 RepID=A0AA40GHU0_9HYME|nr:hypothetical protein K0M31_002562 [Melipona bicolor]
MLSVPGSVSWVHQGGHYIVLPLYLSQRSTAENSVCSPSIGENDDGPSRMELEESLGTETAERENNNGANVLEHVLTRVPVSRLGIWKRRGYALKKRKNVKNVASRVKNLLGQISGCLVRDLADVGVGIGGVSAEADPQCIPELHCAVLHETRDTRHETRDETRRDETRRNAAVAAACRREFYERGWRERRGSRNKTREERERETTPETMNKRGQERKGDKGAKRLGARSKRKGVRVVWALFFHLSGPVLRGERWQSEKKRRKKKKKKKKKKKRRRRKKKIERTTSSEWHPRISISARRDRGCVLISIGKTDLLDRPRFSRAGRSMPRTKHLRRRRTTKLQISIFQYLSSRDSGHRSPEKELFETVDSLEKQRATWIVGKGSGAMIAA